MVKVKSQIRYLLISQEIFYLNKVKIDNLGASPISIPHGFPTEIITGYVVMFINSSGMDQYHHTNISKYGLWGYTSSMGVLQEINLIIDHIVVITWDMQLLQESTGIQTKLVLSIDPIMFGLINVIIVYPYNKITLQVL